MQSRWSIFRLGRKYSGGPRTRFGDEFVWSMMPVANPRSVSAGRTIEPKKNGSITTRYRSTYKSTDC